VIWLVWAVLSWAVFVQPVSINPSTTVLRMLLSGFLGGLGVVLTAYCAIRGFTQIGVL
jgi:hypothetical protein